MRRTSYRHQRTLARPAVVRGVGFLTGKSVRLGFQPAPPNTGVAFVRTDLRPAQRLPARVELVTGTQRRTTLGQPPVHVMLVEHVLAALAGLRIDNCIIEIDGCEPPGLDGSAQAFAEALLAAGIQLQHARRAIYTTDETVLASAGGATLALHPCESDELRITYFLNYGEMGPIGRQCHTVTLTPESFLNELAACRTFLLETEARALHQQGIGLRTSAADLIVLGPRGPINNRLRYANEMARHKVLDIVGDLSLLGHDLRGHVVAYRSGHPLNVELACTLAQRLSPPLPQPCRRAA